MCTLILYICIPMCILKAEYALNYSDRNECIVILRSKYIIVNWE